MPRTAKSKKSRVVEVVAPQKARKARVGNVRELVLKALSGGSKSRAELLRATRASYNGLVMHLAKLKDEGIVSFDASNRIVSLVSKSAGTPKAKTVKVPEAVSTVEPSTQVLAPVEPSAALAPVGYATTVLRDALEQFGVRIKAVEGIEEKVLVLDQLASQIGGPIAVVLGDIKADLLQYGQN